MSVKFYLKRLCNVHKCVGCREILDFEDYNYAMCPRCRLHYDIAKTETCEACLKSAYECTCVPTLLSKSGALTLCKLFFYHSSKQNEPQNKLIYFLKHNRNARVTFATAYELLGLVERELKLLEVSDAAESAVLVNMPRGRRSYIKYGHDQAAELCVAMSHLSDIPYRAVLSRRLGGKEQKKLTAAERRKNIKNAIYAKKDIAEAVKGKYVILVDDVVTTGASMSACVQILRKSGAKVIICCAIAADSKRQSDAIKDEKL